MEKNDFTIKNFLKEFGILTELSNNNLFSIIQPIILPFLVSKYGPNAKFDITANSKGDFELYRIYDVVSPSDFNNPDRQIELGDERLPDDYEAGEEYFEVIDLSEFSNSELLKLKNNLNNELIKFTNKYITDTYSSLVGNLINLDVVNKTNNGYLLTYGNTKLLFELPHKEMLPRDMIRVGDSILVLVESIGTLGKVTRKSVKFMEELLKLKMDDKIDYELVDFARVIGIRTKYVIKGKFDKNIYPTLKYVTESISDYLGGEQVDIIIYSANKNKYLRNCFFNIWVLDAWFDGDDAYVLADQNQIPYILGKNGSNIKLINKLLNTRIQVLSSKVSREEDIELTEYRDEVSSKLLDYLANININTAKDLMRLNRDKLPNKFNAELSKLMELIHHDFVSE